MTNSTALRITSTISQNRSRFSIVTGDMPLARPWLPMTIPATTMASGPEIPKAKAPAYPALTRANVMMISTA